jgi:hypothetical protein
MQALSGAIAFDKLAGMPRRPWAVPEQAKCWCALCFHLHCHIMPLPCCWSIPPCGFHIEQVSAPYARTVMRTVTDAGLYHLARLTCSDINIMCPALHLPH